ncbi:hypothetical protein [Lentzea cavernae]|nr:hypothetical protein [Lentzea cavernae]
MSVWSDLVIALLAGPLVLAGIAKLATESGKLPWPVRSGPLRAPYGPKAVGGAEVVTAILVVLLQGALAAIVAAVAFGVLTVVAAALSGQKCACFGLARLASVGKAHIAGNAIAALVAVAIAISAPPGDAPVLRVWTCVLSAGALGALLFLSDRRRKAAEEIPSECGEMLSGVLLFVSDDCPSCRSLKQLLDAAEPARRAAITTVVIKHADDIPEDMRKLGVPSAVGIDRLGRPVCLPVGGTGPVKALVDTITIGTSEVVGGR